MELEQRYIVFKISDLGNSLKGDEVRRLGEEYAQARAEKGKPPLMGLFIEHDWPEFEPVLRMLSARVDGTPVSAKKVGEPTLEVAMRTAPAQDEREAPIFGNEDHVSIPRGLIGAACSAIDKKRGAPKVLAELRRYTFGDLSRPAQTEQPVAAGKKVGELMMEVGFSVNKVSELVQFILDAVAEGGMTAECGEELGRHLQALAVTEVSPDANVERNRQMLLDRSVVGLKKYGVTTEREDLNLAQWVQHAIEEVLDLANYLQALKANIEAEENRIRKAFLEGFQMRGEADSASPNGCVWRSPEEAWVNSDAEEEFRVVMRKQAGS